MGGACARIHAAVLDRTTIEGSSRPDTDSGVMATLGCARKQSSRLDVATNCIHLDGGIFDGRDLPTESPYASKRIRCEAGEYLYRVPSQGGTYRIELAGAAGQESHPQIKQRKCAGKGAVLSLEVVLSKGVELRFLVGQQGTLGCNGGGGASVLSIANGEERQLLAIAGGGGIQDASLTENGIDSIAHSGARVPGTGGRGGRGGKGNGGQGGQGGAGWLGGSETMDGRPDEEGSRALKHSFEPGYRFNPQFNQHHYGGLGGGGCEWYSTGGGGGYSGGGGAECYGRSGGGGSFVADVEGLSEVEPRHASNVQAGYVRIWCPSFVVTVESAVGPNHSVTLTFTNMAGVQLSSIEVHDPDNSMLAGLSRQLADSLDIDEMSLKFVLRSGTLLEETACTMTVSEALTAFDWS